MAYDVRHDVRYSCVQFGADHLKNVRIIFLLSRQTIALYGRHGYRVSGLQLSDEHRFGRRVTFGCIIEMQRRGRDLDDA